MRRLLISAAILLAFSAALGWSVGLPRLKRIASSIGVLLQLSGAPLPASSATLSEHELEELNSMPPQVPNSPGASKAGAARSTPRPNWNI
jgi:hypothetical protein